MKYQLTTKVFVSFDYEIFRDEGTYLIRITKSIQTKATVEDETLVTNVYH